MDVMLERGEIEAYGLDASHSIVVEVWSDQEQAAISFTLGNNAASGSTFVRLSNDDRVYRARIGGRHRYDYPHEKWKNQVLFDFTVSELNSVSLNSTQGFSYQLSKAAETWSMTPNPGWDLDQTKVKRVLARVGSLRIGRVYDGEINTSDLSLSFQGTSQGVPFAKDAVVQLGADKDALVAMGENRYQTAASVLKPLTVDPQYLRDKHLFNIDPRTQLDTISFVQEAQTITLQQDLSNGFWRVLSPLGMDIDLKQVFFMVNTLATAEAEQFILLDDEWIPRFSVVLRLLSGEERLLSWSSRTSVSGALQYQGMLLSKRNHRKDPAGLWAGHKASSRLE